MGEATGRESDASAKRPYLGRAFLDGGYWGEVCGRAGFGGAGGVGLVWGAGDGDLGGRGGLVCP